MWEKIKFNKNNIKYETGKATLIKMPNNSEYVDFYFWHPSKLVREEGGKGYFKSFSFTEEWEFKIFKKNKKGEIVDELEITVEEMKEIFEVVDEKINSNIDNESYYLDVKIPEKINKKVDIDEDLIK